ncbi:MAG: dipeptide epimerase [Pseudomonadales bacterium]|nr:dipeptide epimerase [Halieaceae bacterium]MCP5165474.1 dipeptide epimerase [Pseudomonadales bacterium]MCP5189937.1 dipeptide epimerase [Pseudomonadales bacterium]MCP5203498.1 dipeptide epimerase [Pseudomonadales bacterium]
MNLSYAYQEWPYAQVFRIAREARSHSALFLVHIHDGEHLGRGECGILTQYGHSKQDLVDGFETAAKMLAQRPAREELQEAIANSSVRNAIDCALWDLECKRDGKSPWQMAGLERRAELQVDITIGINATEKMCRDARAAVDKGYRILKIKANAEQVVDKVSAITAVAPGLTFIVDANEAWSIRQLEQLAPQLHDLGVALIEQPLPHHDDAAMARYRGPIPICADESCESLQQLDTLQARYQAINIKLDKVGGLTPALQLARAAKERGMGLMLGCHGPTSLGIAPAYVVGTLADFRDLDGPALLHQDRLHGMRYRNGYLHCFTPGLWA